MDASTLRDFTLYIVTHVHFTRLASCYSRGAHFLIMAPLAVYKTPEF